MALTSSQAAQVLALLAGQVDPSVFQTVKNILDLQLQANNNLPDGESYTNIKEYCLRLRDKLIASGKGIVADDPKDEMLMVYMDRDKVRRLFNSVPQDGYMAAFPGIHTSPNGKDQLTISLLAADKDLNILPGHISGNIYGEQSWGNRTMMCDLDTLLR
ncbi:hypothetical protein [Taibaiella koreensis]|uniref:hypothetical protein n=1 Tax=Taibaiella koreensis TaxID=1268548 RepID=UPI000E59E0DE|nr:hypothetical protein [Taibaiella koreensis]